MIERLFHVEESGAGRLDKYVADNLPGISRSQLKARLEELTVNGAPAALNAKIRPGSVVKVTLREERQAAEPENIPLDVLFENGDVWVINKPQGMAVHPGAGRPTGTLANGLAYLLQGQRTESTGFRPGIVHRLDMDTSGVIICAKNTASHEFLAEQFRKRAAKKRYLALCYGSPAPSIGSIENYIDRSRRNRRKFVCGDDTARGRMAVTRWRVLRTYGAVSLVLFKPRTGRTHQLRVHANYLAAPILGDPVYNERPTGADTLMLHAWKLKITLPGESEPRVFVAKTPPRFYDAIRRRRPTC